MSVMHDLRQVPGRRAVNPFHDRSGMGAEATGTVREALWIKTAFACR